MKHSRHAPSIVTRGLTKEFGERRAVNAVDLTVNRGEVFGFVGLNGAGKTTFMRMLVGLVRPTAGTFSVLGTSDLGSGVMRRVGTMIEGPAFHPSMTGRQNLRYIARFVGVGDSEVDRALNEVDLIPRADSKYRTYSLGMKQRLGIACALLGNPELLILDEPANGLDPSGIASMRELLRNQAEQGRTVFLSSHLLAEISQICDRVGVLHEGSLVAVGTPEEIENSDAEASALTLTCDQQEVAARIVQGLAGVAGVRVVPDGLEVDVPSSHTASVVSALVSSGIAVTSVGRRDHTLEDAFLSMTAGAARGSHTSEVG